MRSGAAALLSLLACGGGAGGADDRGDTAGADRDTGSDDTGGAATAIVGRPCPEDSALTWSNFGEATMLTHCVGCHSEHLAEGTPRGQAPLGVDFNSHARTQAWLERIHARSADQNRTMPPADTMSERTREQLGDWLACGAP